MCETILPWKRSQRASRKLLLIAELIGDNFCGYLPISGVPLRLTTTYFFVDVEGLFCFGHR
jgi:hypothetical protein